MLLQKSMILSIFRPKEPCMLLRVLQILFTKRITEENITVSFLSESEETTYVLQKHTQCNPTCGVWEGRMYADLTSTSVG
uniref:Putative ovule protein n=1 Tax=Solanum chacoense TaxID=4108 RepID=A0A0V0GKG2_SOLCH